jgi:hypothetical protein
MISCSLKWGYGCLIVYVLVFTASHGRYIWRLSSPRKILSRSKKRRATVPSLDAGERASGFGVCGEHGPKPSEVYGFVGSITTVVAAGSLHRSCLYFMFRLR